MTAQDLLYVAFIVAALLIDHFVFWPRFVRSAAIQPDQARRRIWYSWMGMLWSTAGTGIGLWIFTDRRWALLGLDLPVGWRLWLSAALVLAVLALYASTILKIRKIAGSEKAALRARFGIYERMLPHTPIELAWFAALSVSAGFCEEWVFRAYLVWFLQPFVGLGGAAAISCVAFALGHAYQGTSGVIKTGIIGTLFMVLVLAVGSLIPAIVLHALIDMGQGVVAWLILRNGPPENPDSNRSGKPSKPKVWRTGEIG
jgi:uncharacterized protein